MASCNSYKEVAYFQNADENENYALIDSFRTLRVMPKDVLTFTVAGLAVPEAVSAYNLTTSYKSPGQSMSYGQQTLIKYTVENDGTINYPRVGKVHVIGKTLEDIERDIAHAIAHDFTEQPVVTARLDSYKVTVIGEAKTCGVLEFNSQRSVNVLEALAQNGDLTIYGKRNNVIVVRENIDGEKLHYKLNLNDKNIINNPGYYLKQNDIVYVEPNETRKKDLYTGDSTNFTLTLVSIGASVLSMLLRLL